MNRFKNILYVADTNSINNSSLDRAVTIAETNRARLTIMDVINEVDCEEDTMKRYGISLNKLLHDEKMEYLHQLSTPYQSSKCVIFTTVLIGSAFIEIIRAVIRNHYDLVIK